MCMKVINVQNDKESINLTQDKENMLVMFEICFS